MIAAVRRLIIGLHHHMTNTAWAIAASYTYQRPRHPHHAMGYRGGAYG